MLRKATINLSCANAGKLAKITDFLVDYTVCVNQFIDLLWKVDRFSGFR